MSSDNNHSSQPGQQMSGGQNKGAFAAFAAAPGPMGTERVVPEGPKAPEAYTKLGHGARVKIGLAVLKSVSTTALESCITAEKLAKRVGEATKGPEGPGLVRAVRARTKGSAYGD